MVAAPLDGVQGLEAVPGGGQVAGPLPAGWDLEDARTPYCGIATSWKYALFAGQAEVAVPSLPASDGERIWDRYTARNVPVTFE